MAKTFTIQQNVLFRHCDLAGIVFFPRYFEMMNDCVEAFFETALGTPFHTLHLTHGVPTAQIETRFVAPSRHGEILDLTLRTTWVGGSSWGYTMTAACDEQVRFETTATLVHVDGSGRPTRWPDDLRKKLSDYEVTDVT